MINFCRTTGLALLVAIAAPAAAQERQLTVTLLGTGCPPAVMNRFGPSTLVEAGDQKFVFDAGRGAMQRLTELKVRWQDVQGVFLTHLHSDHVVGFPDLWLTGWLLVPGRNVPLPVWGPRGTTAMMSHLQQAYEYDVGIRIQNDGASSDGVALLVKEISEGVVYDKAGVKVTAFEVDHAPVTPAFGYRIDYAGRSVVLSGDTRVSENLIRHAQGVDLLVHEVFVPATLERAGVPPARAKRIIDYHTTPEQAGQVFARVKPKLAVYSHICMPSATEQDLIPATRKAYAGRLEVGEDLMVIDVGDKVDVRNREEQVRRQVLATDDRRTDALRRGDSKPLYQIYADDYTLVTPSTGVIRTKAEQIADLDSGRVRYEKIEVLERTVRVYSDVAIVVAREKYSILQNGEQVGGDIRFSRTYKQFGADWRVIATHGTFVGGAASPGERKAEQPALPFLLESAQWSEPYAGPSGVPKGAQRAVLGTDPRTGGETYYAHFPAGTRFELHWHAYAEYAVVLRGKVTHILGENRSSLQVGDYVVIPPKIAHEWEVDPSGDAYLLIRRDGPADQHFLQP